MRHPDFLAHFVVPGLAGMSGLISSWRPVGLSRLDVLSLSTDHCLHRLLFETGPEVQIRPRDRSTSFRLVHAFTVHNGTVRDRAFLCGYGKDYAAAIRGPGRRTRFTGSVPFDVPHGM